MSVANEYLPDDEAFLAMMSRHQGAVAINKVSHELALDRIRSNAGFVPVAIDPRDDGLLYWADLGARPHLEWLHVYTVEAALKSGPVEVFATDMSILRREEVVVDSAPVTGLIFHISRCGSTLLSKCLAACPEHIVISQGAPLQRGFWAWASSDFRDPMPSGDSYQAMFRRLVAAMCRRRAQGSRAAFVKFISWNTIFIDFIRSALPGVPAVFMYRDPIEVIASVKKETTQALMARGTRQGALLTGLPPDKHREVDDVDYLIRCYRAYFEAALRARDLPLLNYRILQPAYLEDILLHCLNLQVTPRQLSAMRSVFDVHSKDDARSRRFEGDAQAKHDAVQAVDRQRIRAELEEIYAQLEKSRGNVEQRLMVDALA